MKRKQKAYRREKRKEQVIKQLRIWRENGYANQATSYKLAGALEMSPSQHFIDILNEMVSEGDLLAVEAHPSGRFPTKFYLLTEKHLITEKYSHRHISVRSRGRAVGQLAMPI